MAEAEPVTTEGPDVPDLWTVEEVAASFRITRATMYRIVASGAIETVRVGGKIRISGEAVTEYIARNTRHAGSPQTTEG